VEDTHATLGEAPTSPAFHVETINEFVPVFQVMVWDGVLVNNLVVVIEPRLITRVHVVDRMSSAAMLYVGPAANVILGVVAVVGISHTPPTHEHVPDPLKEY
jgi:hypothetical protein